MGLALACIPIVLYPLLKRYNEALALGYVVFRGALETMTYIAGVVGWMLLLPLSQAYTQASASDAATFQALGLLLRKEAEISFTFTAIVFSIGALMLYTMLYQSRLIPRWLSGWGLLAGVLYLAGLGVGGMLTLTGGSLPLQDLWPLPMLVQEMVLAGWLIVKGFDPAALAAAPVPANERS